MLSLIFKNADNSINVEYRTTMDKSQDGGSVFQVLAPVGHDPHKLVTSAFFQQTQYNLKQFVDFAQANSLKLISVGSNKVEEVLVA